MQYILQSLKFVKSKLILHDPLWSKSKNSKVYNEYFYQSAVCYFILEREMSLNSGLSVHVYLISVKLNPVQPAVLTSFHSHTSNLDYLFLTNHYDHMWQIHWIEMELE